MKKEVDRLPRLKTGNTSTPTRQPLKLLDDPVQIFWTPPPPLCRRVIYSLNFWHSVSVSPPCYLDGGRSGVYKEKIQCE